MTQVVLRCMVPVYIYVETGDDANGKPNGNMGVDKVVVDDEAIDVSEATLVGREENEEKDVAERALRDGIEAARDAYEWPAWQFGF
jgi:hypothetical protein